MREFESVAEMAALDRTFGRNPEGRRVQRQAVCECGKPFTQSILSERFVEIVEQQGARALAALREQVPEFYVPVFCPSCERKDLRLWAQRAAQRATAGVNPYDGGRD